MGFKDWFKKSLPMRDIAKVVETDRYGNVWYLSDFIGTRGTKVRTEYDMRNLTDKALALSACTPLSMVVDKLGDMMSRAIPYVVDKNGNEKRTFSDIKAILSNPNPMQDFSSFIKSVESTLKVFGFCPIVFVRISEDSVPKAMWIVPPEYFHIESTGKLFRQFEKEGIVNRAYISWGGTQIELSPWEYAIIQNGTLNVPQYAKGLIRYDSVTDSLSLPISNWMASMVAGNTLLVNGGPKGILSNNQQPDEMGVGAITAKEEDDIRDKFKTEYGLTGQRFPILVTRYKLSWQPLDFDSNQLKLHEEDARCRAAICNAIGVNPNLYNDAKYDNQESAKKAAYQDVVIPDSIKIANVLTNSICPENAFIKFDFSGVECLQADKRLESETISNVAGAMSTLVNGLLITPEEARVHISKYIDIDPDIPKGEYRVIQIIDNGSKKKEDGED